MQLTRESIVEKMKYLHDYILVEPDPDDSLITVQGKNGKTMMLSEGRFEMIGGHKKLIQDNKPFESISGTIVGVPERFTDARNFNPDRLKLGHKAVFHFNALSMSRAAGGLVLHDETGKEYVFIQVILVYATVNPEDGAIQAIGEYNLIKPIAEDESMIKSPLGLFFKPKPENKGQEGIVHYVGQPTHDHEELDIQPGDKIIYNSTGDIPLMVNGELFFRQRWRNIMAVIK